MTVAFLDIETSGLDPARHALWELALIVDGDEFVFHLNLHIANAEPSALRLNRFYERVFATERAWEWDDPRGVAEIVAVATAGRHLVGAAPWFDAGFLEPFLRRYGHCPAWHHRLICVETYAAGHHGWPLPKSLRDTATELGIITPDDDRHTAIGDARTAKLIYDTLVGTEATEAAA